MYPWWTFKLGQVQLILLARQFFNECMDPFNTLYIDVLHVIILDNFNVNFPVPIETFQTRSRSTYLHC